MYVKHSYFFSMCVMNKVIIIIIPLTWIHLYSPHLDTLTHSPHLDTLTFLSLGYTNIPLTYIH